MTVTKKTAIGRLAAPFTVTDGVVTIDAATTSVAGLMAASDKTKLDGISSGANNYSLPTATDNILGGVKIGSGITITDGVISASALEDFASKTDSDLTLYVYEDATGDADGSSKANGFTSLQDAIDAIPDVAQNVTIIVSKGSTNYLGDTTTIQKASVKSLTIQGEFYAYEACDANAVAGKVVDASADFSDFAAGDRVVCTKYSGTVGSSSISDYFYATITEVGSGYVQTSEETKVPTTGWRYLINQTVFDGNNGSTTHLIYANDTPLTFNGISLVNHGSTGAHLRNSFVTVLRSIFYDVKGVTSEDTMLTLNRCAFIECQSVGSYTGIVGPWYGSNLFCTNAVIDASDTSNGIGSLYNCNVSVEYSGAFGCTKAVSNVVSSDSFNLTSCYIDSTCTYGAYGHNITLTNCTNNAATPVTNLTSGGSTEEWDGQALPSIDDATGGQVLALKSDKSALEFATVSGGASAYGDLTNIPAAIAAIDGLTPAADKIPYYTAADAGALADLPSGYNYIINPCFEVNQRGVSSVNTNGAFPVDRFNSSFSTTGTCTLSQQTFAVGQTDVPGEPKNYLRAVTVTDSTSGEYMLINHKIEDVRTLAGQTATFSFWAKADSTKQIAIELYHNFGSGGSALFNSNNIKLTLTTSWTRYIVVLNMPSVSGKTIGTGSSTWVNWWLSGGSTFNSRTDSLGNQSGTFEFANVKLESGSVATPFVVPTYAAELEKCKRYLQVFGGTSSYEVISISKPAYSTTGLTATVLLSPNMRTIPSIVAPTSYANFALYGGSAIALSANPTINGTNSSLQQAGIECTVASGLTAGNNYVLASNNQTTDRIILSAEL